MRTAPRYRSRRQFSAGAGRRQLATGQPRRLLLEPLEDRRLLATFTVNSTLDAPDAIPGDGMADDGFGNATLRAAIMESNALPGADTINLPPGNYLLTIAGRLEDQAATGDLDITDELTIVGADRATTVIDAGLLDRVFHLPTGSTASISGVTITGGLATDDGSSPGTGQGGGVLNVFGSLTLTDALITGNQAVGDLGQNGQGGGIYDVVGSLSLVDSTISGNQALGGELGGIAQGGGVYSFGSTATASNSSITGNQALGADDTFGTGGGAAQGGGIFSEISSWLLIDEASISGNQAIGGAGLAGPIGSSGGTAEGGGIYSQSSSFEFLSAPGVTGTTISGNQAVGGAGGDGDQLGVGGNGGSAAGGGIFAGLSDTWVQYNSTLSSNLAQGGDGGSAPDGIDGSGGDALGGNARLNFGADVTFFHVTIAQGQAVGGSAGGPAGLDGSGQGGGIAYEFLDDLVVLKSTIVAANSASTGAPDVLGGFVSNGFNLIGDATGSSGFGAVGDLVGTSDSPIDPVLGPLQDNGGPTFTHALLPGSPALDAADINDFLPTDQRRLPRPQDGNDDGIPIPDIGAFEAQPVPANAEIAIQKLTNGQDADLPTGPLIVVGGTANFEYLVTNPGEVPLANVVVVDDNGTPLDPTDDFQPMFVGGDLNNNGLLDLDETWLYAASRTVTPGQYTNVAAASGRNANSTTAPPVSASDPSNHFGVLAAIDIEKATNGQDADIPPGPLLPIGSTALFSYVVTNPGNVSLRDVVVVDNNGTPDDPSDDFRPMFTGGDTNMNGWLDPPETWTYAASRTVTPGQYQNIGYTSGVDVTDTVPGRVADLDFSHHLGAQGGIDIEKLTNGVDADSPTDPNLPQIAPGDPVVWTYEVRNTGNAPLAGVLVLDNNGTPDDPGDDFFPPPVLAGGFNVGDTNMNDLLDTTETWLFQAQGVAQDLEVVLDFETDALGNPLPAGTFITNQYAPLGLNISTSTRYGAMIFDSANPTGNDLDLGTPNETWAGPGLGAGGQFGRPGENLVPLENILIISEDGDASDPDDDYGGGSLIFRWDTPVRVNNVQLVDIEDAGGRIQTFNAQGQLISSRPMPVLGNNSVQIVPINDAFVSQLRVTFARGGAVSRLSFDRTYENIGYTRGEVILPDDVVVVTDLDFSHYRNPIEAAIDLTKLTNKQHTQQPEDLYLLVGDPVVFGYQVRASGDVPLRNVVVVDDNGTPGDPSDDFQPQFLGGDLNNNNILDLNETWSYRAFRDVTPGPYVNVAVASGVDATGATDEPATDTDSSAHFGLLVGIDIQKLTNGQDADTPTGPQVEPGSVVVFDYLVTNTGNIPLRNVFVVDDNGTPDDQTDDFQPPFIGGDDNQNGLLDVGEVWRYQATRIATPGQYSNRGYTIGEDVTGTRPKPVTDNDPSHHFGISPIVMLRQMISGSDANDPADANLPQFAPGEPVPMTYEVTNPGPIPLSQVTVRDDNGTPADPSDDMLPAPMMNGAHNMGDSNQNHLLEQGETWLYATTMPAQDMSYWVNFDADSAGTPLPRGTTINDQYAAWGLHVSSNVRFGAMIFDSSRPTGGDPDLGTPNQSFGGPGVGTGGQRGATGENALPLGNILIVSEDGDASDPDDNYGPGALIFRWDQPVRVDSIQILDVDYSSTQNRIEALDAAGQSLGTFPIANAGNNGLQRITLNLPQVTTLRVNVALGGAVTELRFARVHGSTAHVTADGATSSDVVYYQNPPGSGSGGGTTGGGTTGGGTTGGGTTGGGTTGGGTTGGGTTGGGTTGGGTTGGGTTGGGTTGGGTKFFVVDTLADSTFRYDQSLANLGHTKLAAGNTVARGAASNLDGSRVWVVDMNNNVYVYDAAGASLGSWRAAGVQSAEGIATDGNDIWVLDGGARRVLRFSGAATRLSGQQSAASSFALHRLNAPAHGITTDGYHLWVVDDGTTNQVFKYDLTGRVLGNWALDSRNIDPRGITLDPSNVGDLWVVDRGTRSVYHYVGATAWTSGRRTANNVSLLDINNRGPEGIADPRVDNDLLPSVLDRSELGLSDLAAGAISPFLGQSSPTAREAVLQSGLFSARHCEPVSVTLVPSANQRLAAANPPLPATPQRSAAAAHLAAHVLAVDDLLAEWSDDENWLRW
ncbi:MAG: hypothetical protein J5I93_28325 [Pirellulaceae bacterium]|nr:hypothetical protein [Pirellulaceae bacterium]